MSYSHTSYLEFRNLILARLGDSVFWTDNEVKRYALETLRTFNALAQFSYDRGLFTTTAPNTFYDLPTLLDKSGTKILGYNLTDQDIFLDLRYSLLESVSSASLWTGSSQFNLQDCQDAIEKARNEFLLKTNLVLTHSSINLPSPPVEEVPLSDSIIDVQRASYASTSAIASSSPYYTPLHRGDVMDVTSWNRSWTTNNSSPTSYSLYLTPKVTLQILPPAQVGGKLSLVTLNNPSNLNLSSGVLLNIPDDFAWAIKWKALFYLLSKDGEGSDPFRAAYCQTRFEEAILAAKVSSTVQSARLNDQTLIPTSLENLDKWKNQWEYASATLGAARPTSIAIVGRNLIALYPTPDSTYSVLLDVIRNHPVPVIDGDYIQVGKEHLSALVDYAVHLAMFKVGGSEFMATLPLKDNLIQLAMENNSRLKAQAKNFELLKKLSLNQEIEAPLYGRLTEGATS